MSKDQTLTPLSLLSELGEFDLDPCGYKGHKTAKEIILLPTNGLTQEWSGLVWLNPPYSKPLEWLQKLSEHGNGVALVLASTETRWFQEWVLKTASSIFFLKGRPKFMNNKFEPVNLMRGVILVGYGKEADSRLRSLRIDGEYIKLAQQDTLLPSGGEE